MGAYTFDDPSKIKHGRIGGRKAFSKQFKQQLIQYYGSRDAVTGVAIHERYLQIDHRIPYEVSGDGNAVDTNLDPRDFMLLDGSSNRAKSWSCEHCNNFLKRHDPRVCNTCFWASPEDYEHIAEMPVRRVDIVWQKDEISDFEDIKKAAEAAGVDLATMIKRLLSKK